MFSFVDCVERQLATGNICVDAVCFAMLRKQALLTDLLCEKSCGVRIYRANVVIWLEVAKAKCQAQVYCASDKHSCPSHKSLALLSALLDTKLLLLLLHSFSGLFSSSILFSRYQKGRTSLDLNKARDDGVWGWQFHQLDHMQTICTSLQTDNHTNTSSLNVYRPDALPDAQPTMSEH